MIDLLHGSRPYDTDWSDGIPSLKEPKNCEIQLSAIICIINWMLGNWWFDNGLEDRCGGPRGLNGNYISGMTDAEMEASISAAKEDLDDEELSSIEGLETDIKKTFKAVLKQVVENELDGYLS